MATEEALATADKLLQAASFLDGLDEEAIEQPPKPDMGLPMYDRTESRGNFMVAWMGDDGMIFSPLCGDLGKALKLSRQHKRLPTWVCHGSENQLASARLCLRYRAASWLTPARMDRELRSMLAVPVSANLPRSATEQLNGPARDSRVDAATGRRLAVRALADTLDIAAEALYMLDHEEGSEEETTSVSGHGGIASSGRGSLPARSGRLIVSGVDEVCAALLTALADRIEAAGELYNKLLPIAKAYDEADQKPYDWVKDLESKDPMPGYSSFVALHILAVVFEDVGISTADWNTKDAVKFIEDNKDKFQAYKPYGKYLDWLFRGLGKASKANPQALRAKERWVADNLTRLPEILKGQDIGRLTLDQAIELGEKQLTDSEKIVYTFHDGMTFRRLPKLRHIRNEGNRQHNCCGDSRHMYDAYAEENGWDPAKHTGGIFALRGPNNESMVTVELNDFGVVKQALGRDNAEISKEWRALVDIAIKHVKVLPFMGNLSQAIRYGLKPKNMDLTKADCVGGDFAGVNFSGANFSGNDLSEAFFTGAKLIGCNFDNANMTDCGLTGADMTRASLANIKFNGNLQFRDVIGLDKAKNVDPKLLAWWKAAENNRGKSQDEKDDEMLRDLHVNLDEMGIE